MSERKALEWSNGPGTEFFVCRCGRLLEPFECVPRRRGGGVMAWA